MLSAKSYLCNVHFFMAADSLALTEPVDLYKINADKKAARLQERTAHYFILNPVMGAIKSRAG